MLVRISPDKISQYLQKVSELVIRSTFTTALYAGTK